MRRVSSLKFQNDVAGGLADRAFGARFESGSLFFGGFHGRGGIGFGLIPDRLCLLACGGDELGALRFGFLDTHLMEFIEQVLKFFGHVHPSRFQWFGYFPIDINSSGNVNPKRFFFKCRIGGMRLFLSVGEENHPFFTLDSRCRD